jgi:polar amino acid transport system permease protein
MSRVQTLVHVIMPQAVRLAIPPLTNRMIAITKGTALGSVVAVHEIIYYATSGASEAGNPTPLTLGALAYLIIFVPVVIVSRWVETRFAWKR